MVDDLLQAHANYRTVRDNYGYSDDDICQAENLLKAHKTVLLSVLAALSTPDLTGNQIVELAFKEDALIDKYKDMIADEGIIYMEHIDRLKEILSDFAAEVRGER